MYFRVFLVVRTPDTLFLPPSIVPKWRGLRGLEELASPHSEVPRRGAARGAPAHRVPVGGESGSTDFRVRLLGFRRFEGVWVVFEGV